MIAVSSSSYEKSGCIKCGCDFCYNSRGLSGYGTVAVKCGECGEEFVILADGLTISKIGFGTNEKDIYEYPRLVEHPRENINKHPFIRPDIRPENGIGEFCAPRGVGYDLACFVKSKEAGERIVKMFENVALENNARENFSCRLDYRPKEPLWIQVKIDYKNIGEDYASALSQIIAEDGIITEEKIRQALNIKWNFKNLWTYKTQNYIWSCINLDYMQKLVKYSHETTADDLKECSYDRKQNKNILAMFQIFGLYLQVNQELANDNVQNAFGAVEQVLIDLESDYNKKMSLPRKYADQRVFHEYLIEQLHNLVDGYNKYDAINDVKEITTKSLKIM